MISKLGVASSVRRGRRPLHSSAVARPPTSRFRQRSQYYIAFATSWISASKDEAVDWREYVGHAALLETKGAPSYLGFYGMLVAADAGTRIYRLGPQTQHCLAYYPCTLRWRLNEVSPWAHVS